MTLKFIKKFIFTLVIMFSLITSVALTTRAADELKYLNASVGEKADTVGITWHSTVSGSYLLYGTSLNGSEIANPTKVTPTETSWGMDKVNNDAESGFTTRYVCKANITNLTPNTKYYYQAVVGETKSEVKNFTSLHQGKENKTFLFLTDIQSSGVGFSNSELLINKMLEVNPFDDPSLLVMTGDQVDRGGYEQQWIDYYTNAPTVNNMLQATLPGNHEYYHSDASAYVSNEIYNQFYNNPLNGPADRLGSSYYFMYGDVLFIMLDIVKTNYDVAAQQEWFRNAVKNNPSRWIIVGSHPGLYATGAYVSDAKTARTNWLKVFEECQVDIALNGHEHVYARKNLRYGGQPGSDKAGDVNEALGITYLSGGAAGLKDYGSKVNPDLKADYDLIDHPGAKNNTGVIMSIEDDELKVKRISASGAILDEFSLFAKRPAEITPMTDEEMLNSVTYNYKATESTITFNWSSNLYGNATEIRFIGGNIKETAQSTLIVTNNLTSKTYFNHSDYNNYNFKVEIVKNDGTVISKEFDPIINNYSLVDQEIIYVLDGGQNHPDNPTTYQGKNLPITLSEYLKEPTKPGYKFTGWKVDNDRRVSDVIEKPRGDVQDDIYEAVTLTATWEKLPYQITYDLDGGQNHTSNPTELLDKDLPKRLYAPTKTGYTFVGWMLGDTILENNTLPDTVSENVTLKAVWKATTYRITYILNGGTNPTDAPTEFSKDNKPSLPTPTKDGHTFKGWTMDGATINEIDNTLEKNITLTAVFEKVETKKGCKKNAATEIILSTSILAGSILLLKKKH